MNADFLLSKLEDVKQPSILAPVSAKAIEMICQAQSLNIEAGESVLSTEHLRKIGVRRLSWLAQIGETVTGLEPTLTNIKNQSGYLRVISIDTETAWIYLWLDDLDNVKGCMLGEGRREGSG